MRSMKKLIFAILLCITVMALIIVGLPAMVFAILPAQRSVTADVAIAVKDSDGHPLVGTQVELWEYEHVWRRAITDADGVARFRGERFDHHVSILNAWSTRPAAFPIRVRLPELTDLYYRYDIHRAGEQQCHIFDDSYDYFFGGHWLGVFDDQGQVTTQVADALGRYQAKDLAEVTAPMHLWRAQAAIDRAPGQPARWDLRLELQQSQ